MYLWCTVVSVPLVYNVYVKIKAMTTRHVRVTVILRNSGNMQITIPMCCVTCLTLYYDSGNSSVLNNVKH